MVMVPVAIVQVGWISKEVGADGVIGWALIVVLVPNEIHPAAFFAVRLYVPAVTTVKIPVVLV